MFAFICRKRKIEKCFKYTPVLFYARFTSFCFKSPYHFTPLLDLHALIFGLTPFGSLSSFTLTLISNGHIIFFNYYIFRNTIRAQNKGLVVQETITLLQL